MKKLVINILLVALLFTLTSCTQTDTKEEPIGFTMSSYTGIGKYVKLNETGRIKRPYSHYLHDTQYSFLFDVDHPEILEVNDNGEWKALQLGKATIKYSLNDPKTDPKLKKELKDLNLSDNWEPTEPLPYAVDGDPPNTITVEVYDVWPIYRLYSESKDMYAYTHTLDDYDTTWNNEGVAWYSTSFGIPVTELIHGDHYVYTTSSSTITTLKQNSYQPKGTAFFSNGNISIYDVYTINSNGKEKHYYTTNYNKTQELVSEGWTYNGVAFDSVNESYIR